MTCLGCQADRLPASLVTHNKTRRSFAFVTGDFILYWINICIVSVFQLRSPAILIYNLSLFCLEIKLLLVIWVGWNTCALRRTSLLKTGLFHYSRRAHQRTFQALSVSRVEATFVITCHRFCQGWGAISWIATRLYCTFATMYTMFTTPVNLKFKINNASQQVYWKISTIHQTTYGTVI